MSVRRRNKASIVRASRSGLEPLESRILFAIAVAENLLVNVDATHLPAGTVTDVPNTGTLGGVFEATGANGITGATPDPTTVPAIDFPATGATAGTKGIRFDGTDFMQLVSEAGGTGTLITAPAGITGPDPTTSIEAWVWNPGIPGEETMVSWGHRGGPDGTNMSFNYGNHNEWGAVGHWGQPPDAGWGPPAGPQSVPAAQQWHHLAYTYDGTTTRLYVDGSLLYTEVLGAGVINTHPDTAINLATQLEPDGVTPTAGLRGSLTLGRVRIHDGVLTDAQIANNYNAEKADFVEPTVPVTPPKPANLLVSVDATTLPEGASANDIPNTGPLGGFFEGTGGGDTVPVIDTPIPTATSGTRGILLDGNDYLQLVSQAGGGTGSLLTAPASITGVDPQQSIETWVWNPGIATEETMVSWAKRGGPDGTNMSFNYGSSPDFGAVGHWGSPDIGWGPTVPAAGHWHHLVYTFDGQTTKVYADGQMVNSEVLGPGAINEFPNTPINIGTQMEPDGVTPTPGLRGSLTLGKVRIYSGVLTDAQIGTDYNTEKGQFIEPVIPPPPPANLLVSVDATTLPAGPITDIPNTGPLGGVFEATGSSGITATDPNTVPVVDTPLPGATSGTKGIRLDGTDYLQLVTQGGGTGTFITAPASITGVDPKRSVEVWAWNPNLADEETMVSWGHRGGPDGSNMSFNYGRNPDYGAAGQWGNPDIGWGATNPAAQQWHHLVYTYDGLTTRVYVDGQLANSEPLGPGVINTHPDTPINIGTQLDPDGLTPTGGNRGSLTLGKVRIYEGVLTDTQIANNYNTEKGQFVNPTITSAALAKGPIHRYGFNSPAGDATGAQVIDSIGGANGTVQGAGATFDGTHLVLPGGPSTSAAYVDLPNGILSSLGAANGGTGQVSFEGWLRQTGNRAWSRFYDFGSSTAGEVTGPGGTGNGSDYWMLTAQNGGDTTTHRFEVANFDETQGNNFVDVSGDTLNADLHFVSTWNEATGDVKLYVQGVQVASFNTPILISAINDVNNWLGRSNYLADQDLQANLDEFRIYDHALTPGEVLGDFQAGPNVVNTGGGPTINAVYVRGNTWAGPDANAANTTFGEYLAAKGLGDATYGFRVDNLPADTTVPWINVNQVVLHYSTPLAAGGLPSAGSIILDGQLSDYTVTGVAQLDPQTVVLTLDRALGIQPAPATDPTQGDRVKITVPGGGAGGSAYTTKVAVLQGDADRAPTHRVNAIDLGFVKARANTSTNDTATTGAVYTAFADLNGSGRIDAIDLGAAKARNNDALPPPPPAAALAAASITQDLFGSKAIL